MLDVGKLFQDLEFFDFYANGLGKHSNELNKGKEVLNEFLDRLHLDDSSKVLVRRDVYDTLEVIDKIGKNLVYKDSNIKNLLQNF